MARSGTVDRACERCLLSVETRQESWSDLPFSGSGRVGPVSQIGETALDVGHGRRGALGSHQQRRNSAQPALPFSGERPLRQSRQFAEVSGHLLQSRYRMLGYQAEEILRCPARCGCPKLSFPSKPTALRQYVSKAGNPGSRLVLRCPHATDALNDRFDPLLAEADLKSDVRGLRGLQFHRRGDREHTQRTWRHLLREPSRGPGPPPRVGEEGLEGKFRCLASCTHATRLEP